MATSDIKPSTFNSNLVHLAEEHSFCEIKLMFGK